MVVLGSGHMDREKMESWEGGQHEDPRALKSRQDGSDAGVDFKQVGSEVVGKSPIDLK
jgi:hypothetical protein